LRRQPAQKANSKKLKDMLAQLVQVDRELLALNRRAGEDFVESPFLGRQTYGSAALLLWPPPGHAHAAH